MAEIFPIQTLSHCSDRTKQALMAYGIKDLQQVAEESRADGRSPAKLLRYSIPDVGEKAFFELFNSIFWTLIEQAEKPSADAGLISDEHKDHEAALALIGKLLQGTTGDIGGRDQAKLFAEIAFDMIDAARLEGTKRKEGK